MAHGYEESIVDSPTSNLRLTPLPRENDFASSSTKTSNETCTICGHLPPKLHKIIKQHLPILYVSEKLRQAIPHPPMVAHRRPRNLRDILVRRAVKVSDFVQIYGVYFFRMFTQTDFTALRKFLGFCVSLPCPI